MFKNYRNRLMRMSGMNPMCFMPWWRTSGKGFASTVWRKCSDNTIAAYVSSGWIPQSFAWLCVSGTKQKCHAAEGSDQLPTDPSFLLQPGVEPDDCSKLVGWSLDDDFSGVDGNSGAIGDDDFDFRWPTTTGSATQLIVDGLYKVIATPGPNQRVQKSRVFSKTGDFSIPFNWTVDLNKVNQSSGLTFYIFTGGTFSYIQRRWKQSGAGDQIVSRILGAGETTISNSANSGSFRLRRVGSTIYLDYETGGGWINKASGSSTAALTEVWMVGHCDASSGQDTIVTFDNIATDPTIILDPTGDACT